jgi:hypothetical protein
MKSLKYTIVNLDFLGYPITLNFDRKGSTYKTFIGGLFSLIIIVFSLYYTSFGISKIV